MIKIQTLFTINSYFLIKRIKLKNKYFQQLLKWMYRYIQPVKSFLLVPKLCKYMYIYSVYITSNKEFLLYVYDKIVNQRNFKIWSDNIL